MTRMSFRRALFLVICTTAVPFAIAGCPKKEPPPPQEAPPPPPPAPAPTVVELAPLTDDGGDAGDAAPEAGPKKWGGPAYNANQLKIKQCCNAMRSQAKALGNSPEANMIIAVSGQCDM